VDRQIYEKEGKRGGTMRFAEMVTEYKDESGKVVARVAHTMIETGQGADGGIVMPSWDDLHEGERPAPREFGPLPAPTSCVPGRVGDFNPIHHDEEFAKAPGSRPSSPSACSRPASSPLRTDWLGASNVRRYAVQFREQVWPGDRSCARAGHARVRGRRRRKVDVDLLCTRSRAAEPRSRARRPSSSRDRAVAREPRGSS
jgi:acyl dehydratase